MSVDENTNVPWACIADLGTATVTSNLYSVRSATEQKSKTPRWSAPELLEEQDVEHRNPTQKSDVFSFAMVTIQVRHG